MYFNILDKKKNEFISSMSFDTRMEAEAYLSVLLENEEPSLSSSKPNDPRYTIETTPFFFHG